MQQTEAMTEDSVRELVEAAGARVMSRGGRTEHYGSPREFSFEVKAVFANGLALHIIARQYNYRDPWEAEGRVNDLVDVALIQGGGPTCLPKGHSWFQGRDEEEGVDWPGLRQIVEVVSGLNPKVIELQRLTGDL
ncbi:hypothetical protein [Geothermobacter hydrogeniphilus]|uniref:Uncharacterized protein n=1 Tax=Geothermobacter hydrogeniphilus TaxID=1969733 RepID=A0A1X0YB77_9BACT|nr:hypothetical protein [Geothermobacter hydrogeniphilus]ORJ62480.1 hypothetical protein B5V00_04120 [Geothermobacter hydrogeniphilus]